MLLKRKLSQAFSAQFEKAQFRHYNGATIDAGLTVSPGKYTIETSVRNGIFYEFLQVSLKDGDLDEE